MTRGESSGQRRDGGRKGSGSGHGGGQGGGHGGGSRQGRGTAGRRGHAPRAGSKPGAPRPGREPREARRPERAAQGQPPAIPEGITAADLDRETRRELRSLPKGLAEVVGAHLASATRLLPEDPAAAHEHAVAAARLASRIAVTREAAGVTAYATGHWAQALSELRAARRLSGSDAFLPMMADCERGLGRPQRALALAGSPEAARLDRAGRVEMRIVASGARRDLGQVDAAVVTLQCPELRELREPWSPRLAYAYADALLGADRRDEARQWFATAAAIDGDGVTDAAERLDELDGVVFPEVPDEEEADQQDDQQADQVAGPDADGR